MLGGMDEPEGNGYCKAAQHSLWITAFPDTSGMA